MLHQQITRQHIRNLRLSRQASPPNPLERVKQCIKFLCGNFGIIANHFISLAIAQKEANVITRQVMEMLDEGFFELLKLPPSARAEAADTHPKQLEPHMNCNRVFLHVIHVPPNASFWQTYAYAFNLDGIDTSKGHTLSYIGSTIRTFRKRVQLVHMQPEHRKKSPSIHYAAMDEPGAESKWHLLAATQRKTEQTKPPPEVLKQLR